MTTEIDCELIRQHLKNIENANRLYKEQIELILYRIELRGGK